MGVFIGLVLLAVIVDLLIYLALFLSAWLLELGLGVLGMNAPSP